jgi:N-methylhydantoinase A
VLNAYIGPKVRAYLEGLERMLEDQGFHGDLLIMQSNGGVMAPSTAKVLPVAMLESGPVGGFIAAARVGRRLGYENVIGFDMGGTTAKTNLIRDGEPTMAHGYHIGGYVEGHPMMLPVVDTVEVGSGGGSIARVDEVGSLRVGPESAGADPGPVCYARGGTGPTVTDANLVLGRLDAGGFLGGEMRLDVEAARVAIRTRIGEPLGLTDVEAALAVVKIAVLNMSLAVRQVSVERGYDPRDFAMVAFGGAGPLHAVEVARSLHIPIIIVPNFPGQFSAAGMLMADLRHDYVRTYYKPLEKTDFDVLRGIAQELELDARKRLGPGSSTVFRHFLEVRYSGQDFSIPIPIHPEMFGPGYGETIRSVFNHTHQRQFGYHDPAQPLELVSIRLAAVASRELQDLPMAPPSANLPQPVRVRRVFLETATDCPVYVRDQLAAGARIAGPAIIQEYASTTILFPGDQAEVRPTGELIVHLRESLT